MDGSRHRLMALAAALKSNEDFPKFLKKTTAQKLSWAMGQKKGYQHETMDLIHVFFPQILDDFGINSLEPRPQELRSAILNAGPEAAPSFAQQAW